MDTTELNIKMCDCQEIQGLRPQVMVGSTPHYHKGEYSCEIDTDGNVRYWPPNARCIWLPRQDDLQKMVERKSMYGIGLIYDLRKFLEGAKGQYVFDYSMEQLWLVFVMKKKYNKTWDGEKWTN